MPDLGFVSVDRERVLFGQGGVDGIGVRDSGDTITIEIEAQADTDLSLELYTASQRCRLLGSALGREVEVRVQEAAA